jgi:hypothetical protein
LLNLSEVLVRPVRALEQQRFQKLMQNHHYLGALRKISETLWYVATFHDQWVALLSFSAAALDRMGLSPSVRSAKTAHQ